MTAPCYTFDADGSLELATVPQVWGFDTLPYWRDWDRWQNHVAGCAQCAQYVHELANVAPLYLSEPCPIGAQMVDDYQYAVASQHIESRAN